MPCRISFKICSLAWQLSISILSSKHNMEPLTNFMRMESQPRPNPVTIYSLTNAETATAVTIFMCTQVCMVNEYCGGVFWDVTQVFQLTIVQDVFFIILSLKM